MKSDIQIKENILEEILRDPQLTKIASRIGVSVKYEVVTLSGIADYYFQHVGVKHAAQRIAGIINKINIKPRTTKPCDIKRKVNAAFHRSDTIDVTNILVTVDVEDFKLTVSSSHVTERKQTENVLLCMPGITFVKNRLEINSEILAD
jgi:osmotically-inducible protein OsmY